MSTAAEGRCERATTGMINLGRETRRGGWEASRRSVESGGGSSAACEWVYSRGWSAGVTCVGRSLVWLGWLSCAVLYCAALLLLALSCP